nr:venom polypeptide precursor [Doratifera vulnerans]
MNFKVLGFVLLFVFFYAYAPVDTSVPAGRVRNKDGGVFKPLILPERKRVLE